MDYPASLYMHTFNLLPQFGPARLVRLSRYFENWQTAFHAGPEELTAAGIEEPLAAIFVRHRDSLDLEVEQEKLSESDIGLINYSDKNYPKLLLEIAKFPPLLYCRGAMVDSDELSVAVVGTRMVTGYGRAVTPRLIEPLAAAGVTIVSGLAFGIDSLAHTSAINTRGRTIAILGGGLDDKSLYPKAHALLADRILDCGGALLSEYPPGTPNFKQHFVARNRIISGMSLATVVIESDLKSGSLITAKYALEQNRAVYAVPGPIYSRQSQGPNNLIKMGARPVTDAKEILEDLNVGFAFQAQEPPRLSGDSPAESLLLKTISLEPMHINEIVKQTELSAADASSALTFLEMKGKIRNLGGQQYILSR